MRGRPGRLERLVTKPSSTRQVVTGPDAALASAIVTDRARGAGNGRGAGNDIGQGVPRVGPTGRPIPVFPDPEPLTHHGPARVVSICNQKGGVGKTTTTINLGAALAEYGRRVLLVDFDPQGALSVGLGKGDPRQLDVTIHNLLLEHDTEWEDVVIDTGVEGMDLLPSNIDLSGAEVQLVHEVGREYILAGSLKSAIPHYDYILIDCQPSLGLLTVNALAASNGVLI